MWKSITGVFAGVGQWFQKKFSDAWEGVKKVFSGVGSFFSGIWKTITGVFTDIGTSVASAVSGAIRSGLNGALSTIENIINGGINLINGAIDLINKIPGVNIGKIGRLSLPRLAKGGVLNGAQTVIAGEAGPEAIIPLDKLFAQMDKMAETIKGPAGTNNIVINVYGNEGQSAREMAEEVKRVLINEVNRRRLAWQ
jgi:phage-related protein